MGILTVLGSLVYPVLYAPYRLRATLAEGRTAIQQGRTEAICRGETLSFKASNGAWELEQGEIILRRWVLPQGMEALGELQVNALEGSMDGQVQNLRHYVGQRQASLCLRPGGRVWEVMGGGC
ncbi:hypothetical protein YIM730264_14910 [Thermus hydrothermalis]